MNKPAGLLVLIIALAAMIILISQTAKQPTTVLQQPAPPVDQTPQTASGSSGELIGWEPNLDTALTQARQQDKKVMVYFYSRWCRFCKKLEKETYPDPEVASLVKQHLIAVRVDKNKHRELAIKYVIPRTPTIMVTDAEGKEIGRIEGFRAPQLFREEILKILSI